MHKSFHHIFRLRKSFFAMLKETMFNLKNVEKIVAKILIVSNDIWVTIFEKLYSPESKVGS